MMTWENRSFTLFYTFETTKKVFLHAVKLCIIIPFFSLHDDMRFHPLSREIIQYYLVSWHKNCLKDQFQQKPGSFFYFIVPQFHLKLTNKNGKFCDQFLAKKLKFLGSFMKPWYWHKLLKLSVWPEKNWNWRHAANSNSFRIFRWNCHQFHLSLIKSDIVG